MPSPKLVPLLLSEAECESLEALVGKRTALQSLAQRARIVLACAEDRGHAADEVADQSGVSREMVRKWRVRFMEGRMDGLTDEPRPGAPRKITDADVERVVTRTLETKPKAATHWSTRGMARRPGSRRRPSAASGGPSASSRTGSRPSSCRPTRTSSTRSATSSGCT